MRKLHAYDIINICFHRMKVIKIANDIEYSDLFKYLPEFMTAAGMQSFQDASAVLYTSRSSLSRHMSAMEQSLGLHLFDRSANSVKLTKEGELLYKEGKDLYRRAKEFRAMAAALSEPSNMTLSFAIANCYFPTLFSSLHSFREEHPEIAFSMLVYELFGIIESIKNGNADAAITFDFTTYGSNMRGIKKIVLAHSCFSVIMSSSHPLKDKESLKLSDIEKYKSMLSIPLITLSDMLLMNQGLHAETIGRTVPIEFTAPPSLDFVLMTINSSTTLAVLPDPVSRYVSHNCIVKQIEGIETPFDVVFLYKASNNNPALKMLIESNIEGKYPVEIV